MKTSKFVMQFFLFCGVFLTGSVYASPSFDCTKVKNSSIEQLICNDEKLSELDRKLSATFKEAEAKVKAAKNLATLKATQRGWIKGRNDCWKDNDPRNCVMINYQMRISEIQAEYGLVKASNSFIYTCPDAPQNLIEVTYFPTETPTAKAKRKEQQSFMYGRATSAGMLYKGPNESISIHQEDVSVSWGYDAKAVQCNSRSNTAQ